MKTERELLMERLEYLTQQRGMATLQNDAYSTANLSRLLRDAYARLRELDKSSKA